MILVTSGSVNAGRQRIRREQILNSSPLEMQGFNVCLRLACSLGTINHASFTAAYAPHQGASSPESKDVKSRAAAACGQSAIMALYDLLFSHMDLACSQLLVTRNEFLNDAFRTGLSQVSRISLHLCKEITRMSFSGLK